MKRISTDLPNLDMRYYLQNKEWKLNEMQNRMASQSRILNLRDDPIAAGHSTRFQSRIVRLERFSRNIDTARGDMALAEGNLRSALEVMQRVRELAVEGANGIYNREQMGYMAQEVDQMLNELLLVANARSGEGNYLFSGFRSKTEPFRVHRGLVEGSSGEVATGVEYLGDIGRNAAEIEENADSAFSLPGNVAFWAEPQQIFSNVDASTYQVQQNSRIRIDGKEIELKEGDNLHAVVARINDSGAPVRAKIDPVKNSLVLETTYPHQIWPEDLGEGRVLQELGILSSGGASPSLKLAETARTFGGSIFDMVLHLRDRLYHADTEAVGGSALRGIDQAIESLTANLADLGARDTRFQAAWARLDHETPQFIGQNSKEVDLDLAQAITELKMLEHTHQAALGTAGRILRPTLLDFLR